ncbi:unnamed protein product, partial [marine sediment metagenome]
KINYKIAKSVFEEMFSTGKNPQKIIEDRGLEQISNEGLLEAIIEEVIKDNPGPVEQFKEGKDKAIGFLIGRVMTKTKGKANPGMVNEIIIKKLS